MEEMKRAAAAAALELVKDGMRLGLGTGSTAKHFVDLLGERVRSGLKVVGVPTSERTHLQAAGLGIPLTTLEETPELDLTIDGADEIDPHLSLIKGGGGALLREKIVAMASKTMVVIADDSKLVERLGAFPLPVEVNPFGLGATQRLVTAALADAGCPGAVRLRRSTAGDTFRTDGGHVILDCHVKSIPDASRLQDRLFGIAGVVETGLFLGICTRAYVATANGVALKTISP